MRHEDYSLAVVLLRSLEFSLIGVDHTKIARKSIASETAVFLWHRAPAECSSLAVGGRVFLVVFSCT